jgi:Ribbon-helix-helix protein, copG family
MRGEVITLRLSNQEVARLDELRGAGMSRSGFIRQLLRQSGPLEELPTRTEALRLLAESARAGKVAAQIALARELRDQAQRDIWDWVENG